MISQCEQCDFYNWRKMQTIIDAFKDAGLSRPNHIWCQATNRPEDIQWSNCDNYKPLDAVRSYRKPSKKVCR